MPGWLQLQVEASLQETQLLLSQAKKRERMLQEEGPTPMTPMNPPLKRVRLQEPRGPELGLRASVGKPSLLQAPLPDPAGGRVRDVKILLILRSAEVVTLGIFG